ncbi:MAG: Na+/H+ antiporter NhaA [Nitriliruptorales bacterium]
MSESRTDHNEETFEDLLGIGGRNLLPKRFVPERYVKPVLDFMRTEASGGIVMLVAAVAALVWANSAGWETYERLWETHLTIDLGGVVHIDHSLREWVNDALMVIFFFVVGLEIKRELAIGELRDPKTAALPAIAAIGGMVVPALIYFGFNAGTEAVRGWGIPMATDIAFAVGVVALTGTRVPIGAKLFLLALAIVDDIGAILVIAVFYTEELALGWLAAAIVGIGVVILGRTLQIRSVTFYIVVGVGIWFAMLESGVHATLTGVALGFLTPVRPLFRPDGYADSARALIDRVEDYAGEPDEPEDPHTGERIASLLRNMRTLSAETVSPLHRMEHGLAVWSSFVVVPIFAFANSGVRFVGVDPGGVITDRVVLGVFFGLLVGKLVGVSGFAGLAVLTGVGRLPHGTRWRHVFGLALLAGVGFTVALFVTALAFRDPALTDSAKIGIFAASLVAGVVGYTFLRTTPEPQQPHAEDLAPS